MLISCSAASTRNRKAPRFFFVSCCFVFDTHYSRRRKIAWRGGSAGLPDCQKERGLWAVYGRSDVLKWEGILVKAGWPVIEERGKGRLSRRPLDTLISGIPLLFLCRRFCGITAERWNDRLP